MDTIIIPDRLPGYNQLKAKSWQESMRIKRDAVDYVLWILKTARIKPLGQKATVTISCYEPDLRRDEDNVQFGAAKIVLDALQQAGILRNDNRKCVSVRHDPVRVDKEHPRVEVRIEEDGI